MKQPEPPEPPDPRHPSKSAIRSPNSQISSFAFAFAGLFYVFRTQRNFRIHIAIALVMAFVGLLLGLSLTEWAMFGVMVTVVLAAEMTNTMVEALVDLVSPGYHPLAKVSKDVAAGVVLLTAIGAVVVGLLIFGPKLLAALRLV
ncbi:MAG: diacylglycerol kinase [Chloroflexia bacterium]|jgi:diacylglycerol kinase|nr:diacylglycerol kinase [Chloroflexia bacterium]